MFHHFHDGRHPAGQGSLSAHELADVIRFLGPARILPAREWLTRALAGTFDRGDLCLTFDDNLRCQYDVALPVLRHRIITNFNAEADGLSTDDILMKLLDLQH